MPEKLRFKGGVYEMNQGVTGIVGIATDSLMQAALLAQVERGKDHAEAIAPMDKGEYANRFETEVTERGSGPKRRAMANLTNTDPKAATIEWGTKQGTRGKPQRILGQTLSFLKQGGKR